MERNQRIVFFLLLLITVLFIISPFSGYVSCEEPEPTLALMFLQKIGLVKSDPVCPTIGGTIMSVVKSIILVLAGVLVGYIHGCKHKEIEAVTTVTLREEEEEDEVYARKLRYLRSVMEEVHFPEDFVHESLIQKRSIF